MFNVPEWSIECGDIWNPAIKHEPENICKVVDDKSKTHKSIHESASRKKRKKRGDRKVPNKRNKYRKVENLTTDASICAIDDDLNRPLCEAGAVGDDAKLRRNTTVKSPTENKNSTRKKKIRSGKSKIKKDKAINGDDDEGERIIKTVSVGEIDPKCKLDDDSLHENIRVTSELNSSEISNASADRSSKLRNKMLEQLSGGRFRYLNEQLYTMSGHDALRLFQRDETSFELYHEGYRKQVKKWPMNPLDVVVSQVQKMSDKLIVADFGCGDARLAQTFPDRKIHSFDLVSLSPLVTPCDMSKVPLSSGSVDICIFCLSLMGSNLGDYIIEANRVLKHRGTLKIAELLSRFDSVSKFVNDVNRYGFTLIKKDELNDYFVMFDFKKVANVKRTNDLPDLNLNPCLYKRR